MTKLPSSVCLLVSVFMAVFTICLNHGCKTDHGLKGASPETTLKAFVEAVRRGNYATAYDLMSADFRKAYDRQEFTKLIKENNAIVDFLAEKLSEKAHHVRVEAIAELGNEDRLKLVLERGEWKFSSNPVDFYSQRTPKEALKSFIRAIENKRYDIVLKFVPSKWASSMTIQKIRNQWENEKKHEVAALIKNLKANLNSPMKIEGNVATMPYGGTYEVKFIRESGVWKIEDPD